MTFFANYVNYDPSCKAKQYFKENQLCCISSRDLFKHKPLRYSKRKGRDKRPKAERESNPRPCALQYRSWEPKHVKLIRSPKAVLPVKTLIGGL